MDVDLFLLGNWERFENLCFHLARIEEGYAVRMGLGGDGGRDVVVYTATTADSSAVFKALQCKYTKDLGSNTRRSIERSLDSLGKLPVQPVEWILCLPVDPSGSFLSWLEAEMHGRNLAWKVWGRSEILARLRESTDVLHQFFYPVYAELRELFVAEDMRLVRMELDSESQWVQPDPKVLIFCSTGNVLSPDLIFDVIVQNRGDLEAVLFYLTAHVRRFRPIPHGFPGDALLHPQITYKVSINEGDPGDYSAKCEPPLVVKPRSHERFKVALSDTGYSWGGTVQLGLHFGESVLFLPAIELMT
jgi:hypothetical protein